MIPSPASAETAERADIVVLGIGNLLLGDEGAGVHALRRLEQDCRHEDVRFVDGGTLGFAIAGLIEASPALIVLDAAQMSAPAGTVTLFEGAEMDAFVGSNRKRSVHEVGLLDLLAVAALGDRLPARRALIGIQPDRIDWADVPTPVVASAIPRACWIAQQLIERWHA
jgi:hydrogenase maturation protease